MANPFWFWGREELFNRLMDRFLLELTPRDPTAYLVHRSIQPVTQADELLKQVEIKHTQVPTGGTSAFLSLATVPGGERWKLKVMQVATNSGTVEQPRVHDGTNPCLLGKPTGASTIVILPDVTIKEGWTLGVYLNYVAGGLVDMWALVEVEKSY